MQDDGLTYFLDITPALISLAEVAAFVGDPAAGGIDIFIGTTRDHHEGRAVLFLEYEAYAPMALKEMEEIVRQIRAQWDVKKVAIVHRIGRVDIGEASVVIAVSAAHRDEAFKACRYAIDTLKQSVPIWKKEHFVGGEEWIGENRTEDGKRKTEN